MTAVDNSGQVVLLVVGVLVLFALVVFFAMKP